MNMHGNISATIVSECTLKSGFIRVLAESSNFPPSKEDLFRIKQLHIFLADIMELEFKSRRCHPRTKTWKSALTELMLLQLLSYSNTHTKKLSLRSFYWSFKMSKCVGVTIPDGTNLIVQGVNPRFETYAATPGNKTQSWRFCLKNYPWRWLREQIFESWRAKLQKKSDLYAWSCHWTCGCQTDQGWGHWVPPSPQGCRISLSVCSTVLSPARKEEKIKVLGFAINIGL